VDAHDRDVIEWDKIQVLAAGVAHVRGVHETSPGCTQAGTEVWYSLPSLRTSGSAMRAVVIRSTRAEHLSDDVRLAQNADTRDAAAAAPRDNGWLGMPQQPERWESLIHHHPYIRTRFEPESPESTLGDNCFFAPLGEQCRGISEGQFLQQVGYKADAHALVQDSDLPPHVVAEVVDAYAGGPTGGDVAGRRRVAKVPVDPSAYDAPISTFAFARPWRLRKRRPSPPTHQTSPPQPTMSLHTPVSVRDLVKRRRDRLRWSQKDMNQYIDFVMPLS
jgi:hypothetical protein